MSIDLQLYLLSGGMTVLVLIAAWQAFKLRGSYQSQSSLFGAFVFLLMGARQLYTLIRLKSNIANARARGYMIEHLTVEQWIVGVAWVYAIIVGFIVWQHWQHRDLKRLGV